MKNKNEYYTDITKSYIAISLDKPEQLLRGFPKGLPPIYLFLHYTLQHQAETPPRPLWYVCMINV